MIRLFSLEASLLVKPLPTKNCKTSRIKVVYHLQKMSGNSGWFVNGTRLFGSFHWKNSGKKVMSEKVVPFSRWNFPLEIVCSIY